MIENSNAVLAAAQEIMDLGQLWITIDGESIYIPELLEQLEHNQPDEEEEY